MSDIHPTHEAENILQFESPDSFDGRLWKYQAGHSVLILRFSKGPESVDEFVYVGFEMVRYIDLPTFWQGGNIKTASEQECLTLLREINFFGQNTEIGLQEFMEYTLAGMRLFLIVTPKKQYKVLAMTGISISTEPYI